MDSLPSTILQSLSYRQERQPESTALSFLNESGLIENEITYRELCSRAQAVANWLNDRGARGARAFLLFPTGIDFAVAFIGCLAAGCVAVPIPSPEPARLKRTLPRLLAVAEDSRPAFVLTTSAILQLREQICSQSPSLSLADWASTEDIIAKPADWRHPDIAASDIAYLQYTSGSTSVPKGVMIRHSNIVANLKHFRLTFCDDASNVGLNWMPHFHDFGLVWGLMHPLYEGRRTFMMSPLTFLKRPVRWLEAISRYRVSHSAAPNFGFDYCVRKIAPEQRAALDLSCWAVAHVGAEPVRHETLMKFAEAFSPSGFRLETFCPAYGLAEGTLVVAGTRPYTPLVSAHVDGKKLDQNLVVEVADQDALCRTIFGYEPAPYPDKIAIVDPVTGKPSPPNSVGEIWFSGPSVAAGYWNRPEENEQTFGAQLPDDPGAYLRTGDLGFMLNGRLFVTGRLKDLIIIAGANCYPQDIEASVEASHVALKPDTCAAFSIDVQSEEKLVIACEAKPKRGESCAAIFRAIRQTVAHKHELDIYAICLLRSGGMLKTSSGKIQRRACKEAFLNGTLEILEESRAAIPATTSKAGLLKNPRFGEIRDALCRRLAQLSGTPSHEIDLQAPMAQYGLTSLEGLNLLAELEDHVGRPLSPPALYEYSTVDSLARYLSGEPDVRKSNVHAGRLNSERNEPIAIIGMGCRFPGARNPEAFWDLLRCGVDAVSEVPAERWDLAAVYSTDLNKAGKMVTRWGAFLDDVDLFDPQFFGISPREASLMDPQQRILLEVAWEALESAGLPPRGLEGSRTGVFVGVCTSDYATLLLKDRDAIGVHTGTGSASSIAANRLSYTFDFRGPSATVDTACSSSLVAVHLACESLRSGQSDLALAGGANLVLIPEWTIAASQARMMSEDGRCKTFDAAANGYVRGEGCGLVVLKRLSDALRDGDTILAVARGSAVNQDGRSNGLTAPNPASQQDVIRLALNDARMSPEDIDYVEAHGSGTPLGDPIEFESLAAAVGKARTAEQPCHIGSVKTNIGHLEAAAGIAGLIKVVLSLTHGEIPPHLHLKKINPYIQLEGSGLDIPTERRPWRRRERPRAAGVSSFGFGGTNAHIIVEEAPPPGRMMEANESRADRDTHLLCLSAKTETALKELAMAYEDMLSSTNFALADISYTANVCRSHFRYRVALIASSCRQAAEMLGAFRRGESMPGLYQGTSPDSGESADGEKVSLEGVAEAYGRGAEIDWTRLYSIRVRRKAALPAYPFQRQRCWIEAPARRSTEVSPASSALISHPLAGTRLYSPALKDVVFQSTVNSSYPDYLDQHRVYGKVVMPATALSEMVLAAAHTCLPSPQFLEEVIIAEALVLNEGGAAHNLQTVITADEAGLSSFQIVSSTPGSDGVPAWKVLATGRIRSGSAAGQNAPDDFDGNLSIDAIQARCRDSLDAGQLYSTLRLYGLDYGPDFRLLNEVRHRKGEALGSLSVPDRILESPEGYVLHPTILDSCLHLLAATMPYDGVEEAYIPVKLQSLRVFARPAARMFCRTVIRSGSGETHGSVTADFHLAGEAGQPIAEVRGAVLRRVPRQLLLGTEENDFRSWLYRIEWRTRESEYIEAQMEPGVWLAMVDRSGTGDSMRQLLDDAEQQWYSVMPGEDYNFDGRCFTVNPMRPADFQRMFVDLARAESLPLRGIVQLWALDKDNDRSTVCAATLHLIQALTEAQLQEPPRLCIVTRATQAVKEVAIHDPRAASLWGLANVVHAEHPEWRTVSVDLDVQSSSKQDAQFIVEEVVGPHIEPRVALRGKLRYVPRIVRFRATGALTDKPAFSAGATYLITGGLGAIGLNVAQWLARRGARQLVLLGRRGPSEAARAAIDQLRQKGAHVRVETADVADMGSLRRAMTRWQRELPPLRGVFHAAGVLDDASIEQLNWQRFASVMSAKVEGTYNLHELTREMPLDHFVLFSSMSSLLPNSGQSNYAAANAFLDSFAGYRRGQGLPAVAIHWSLWDVSGLNANMNDHERARMSRMGLGVIDPARGIEALEFLVERNEPETVVFPADWAAYLSQFGPGMEPPLTSVVAEEFRSRLKNDDLNIQRQQLRDTLEESSPSERIEILEDFLKQHVIDVLGFQSSQQLDPSVGFSEIGMDSVMAVELQHRIQRGLGVSLPATALFDKPNIHALARHLSEKVLKFELALPHAKPAESGSTTRPAEPSDALDAMSEDELVALLSEELDKAEGQADAAVGGRS